MKGKELLVLELKSDKEALADIRNSLGLNNIPQADFNNFIYLCEIYRLDPRLNQISAWKQEIRKWNPETKQNEAIGEYKLVVNINVDGFLTIANREPEFNGIEAQVIYKGDTFKRLPGGKYEYISGQNFGNPSQIIGAFCVVHRKDREIPTLKHVSLATYYQEKSLAWKNYKEAMIEKVAKGRAIKESFCISGIITEEEVESLKVSELKNVTPQENSYISKQDIKKLTDNKKDDPTKPFNFVKLNGEIIDSIEYRVLSKYILKKRPNYSKENIRDTIELIVNNYDVGENFITVFNEETNLLMNTKKLIEIAQDGIKLYQETKQAPPNWRDLVVPGETETEKWLFIYIKNIIGDDNKTRNLYNEIIKRLPPEGDLAKYLEIATIVPANGDPWNLDSQISKIIDEMNSKMEVA